MVVDFAVAHDSEAIFLVFQEEGLLSFLGQLVDGEAMEPENGGLAVMEDRVVGAAGLDLLVAEHLLGS